MIRHLLILLVFFTGNPGDVANVNRLKKEAEQAYKSGNYNEALDKYRFLADSLNLTDANILLNKAHCLYQLNDTAQAKSTYQSVTQSESKEAQSIAYQQLGVMAKQPNTLNESLQLLKAAIKANPKNTDARYDYELVKKLIDQQQEQNQDQENQDNQDQNQENQDQQQQDQKDGDQNQENQKDQQGEQNKEQEQQEGEDSQEQQQEQEGEKSEEQQQKEGEQSDEGQEEGKEQKEGEEGEEKEEDSQPQSTSDKLKEMNISEEKARMILEALRNNEVQYIQQQQRKATKRPDSGRPDW